MANEFLYSSLICFEISSFKFAKSFAPIFLAKSSLIFTSSGILTAVILHSNTALLLTSSFSGKFSGRFTSTFFVSPDLTPSNCLSKPFINKSFPRTN